MGRRVLQVEHWTFMGWDDVFYKWNIVRGLWGGTTCSTSGTLEVYEVGRRCSTSGTLEVYEVGRRVLQEEH